VYDVLRASDMAVVTSGTATLETGLMGIPMVIVYRISGLTYYLLTKLVRGLAHVGLVNIVANKRLVPELIQHDATLDRIFAEVSQILDDPDRQRIIREGLGALRSQLGEQGASYRAAEIVLGQVRQNSVHGNL
jgi:lipid-A-disaccharide synthase